MLYKKEYKIKFYICSYIAICWYYGYIILLPIAINMHVHLHHEVAIDGLNTINFHVIYRHPNMIHSSSISYVHLYYN